ncbi:Fe-Mn family superoxide dismutase [Alkalibaculum bacchi]|jgi:Fe-Mn family superoxide dismutase|uniref:Fe-Mn family superoxide dismutase n=1 Tax=Alkalibaculum bacchi TaxID=645887 RepID=UPI0026EF6C08|nr:Fe-Mn family superoxide dismutase [Alkalibaculum bacchi]
MSIESVIKPKIIYEAKALPYEYDELEPIITKSMLKKFYSDYEKCVKYLNDSQYTLAQTKENLQNYQFFDYWEEEITKGEFLLSLYEVYWSIMSPLGLGGYPGTKTIKLIKKSLAHFNQFKEHLINAADTLSGSGWSVLMYLPQVGQLKVFQVEEGKCLDNSIIPILSCYVQDEAEYPNLLYGRREYLENWWNLINWFEVEKKIIESIKKP